MTKHLNNAVEAPGAVAVPLVAIMLGRAADRRILVRSINHVCTEPRVEELANARFDLCIIDLPTLLRCEHQMRELRNQADPVLTPVLLAATEAQLSKANSYLGDLADDVIRTPIRRVELTSRIDNLLHLGSLSRAQQRETESTQSELNGATRALQAFSACNERVIHATGEAQMLTDVCNSLVKEGHYALAWVGQAHQQPSGQMRSLASASEAGVYLGFIDAYCHQRETDPDPIRHTLRTGKRFVSSEVPLCSPEISRRSTAIEIRCCVSSGHSWHRCRVLSGHLFHSCRNV